MSNNRSYELSGAELLDAVHDALKRYVVLPSAAATDALVLWIAATHGQPAWQHATRLVIRSPEKRCGKSRLLDLIEAMSHRPLVTVNATVAAIFRSIKEENPPTLLIDEADAIFGKSKGGDVAEDLRGLLNAGFGRGRAVLRCVGPNQIPTEFASFAMAALAAIGDTIPDTITDRAVVVTMRRRAPGEAVSPYRVKRDEPGLRALRDLLAAWVRENLDWLEDAAPELPVEDRAADVWESMVATADLAGGSWPERARLAAVVLSTEQDTSAAEESLGMRLLGDVRIVFEDLARAVISSEDLVTALRALVESPWDAFDFKQRDLARRLRPYGIRSAQVRPNGQTQVRGYRLEDFGDAFDRYLRPAGEESPSVTPSQNGDSPTAATGEPVTLNPGVTDRSVTDEGSATAPTLPPQRLLGIGDVVTDCDGGADDLGAWTSDLLEEEPQS
jgi:hypothetical protein